MKFKALLQKIGSAKKPLLAVLIDPDKFNPELVRIADPKKVSCFLVGGSRLHHGSSHATVKQIRRLSSIPVVLFPGDETQLTPAADGLLLPSLLSGRNPEYLIGKQVIMAPLIRKMKLEHVPMAYLLIDSGNISATRSVTATVPLSINHRSAIVHTALAAQQLGFKLLYLEAGSGASSSVPAALVRAVKKQVSLPVIVGGGIDSKQKMLRAVSSGANMIVVGNALEKNVYLLHELSACF